MPSLPRRTATNGVEIDNIFTCFSGIKQDYFTIKTPKSPQGVEQETQLDSIGNRMKHQ